MNIVEKIKAKQIADAKDKGLENPYLAPKGPPTAVINNTPSKVQAIKAKQLEKDPELYTPKPLATDEQVALTGAAKQTFEQLQAAMQTDIARIKTHKNLSDKNALKATLIPNYWPFVQQYMEQEHDYPNSVAVQLMVWLLDVGDIEKALKLATYLMQAGNQTLPANFKCDIPTLLCREMYEWANAQLKEGNSAEPYLGKLVGLVHTSGWDLPIAVESQTYVIAAKHAAAQEDFKACLALCIEAEKVNPKGAGVKTLKAKAEKALEK